jgi:sialate O-acetylesterase
MEFDVTGVLNYSAEQADSVHYPNMRLFEIQHNPQNQSVDEAPIKGVFNWVAPSPKVLQNASTSAWRSFSAVCYYTGRELMRKDPSVPLGLLTTCFGGTSDRRWSSPEALKQCNLSGPSQEQFSDLWYGMVTPFLKMRFSAMLWYQGEADQTRPHEYSCTFPAMIQNWRKHFNLPNIPFGFVELAGYPKYDYSLIRLAQQEALKVPNVFMATAIDLGDPTSPWGSVHPRLKQEVARRLSLGLQKELYNIPVLNEGPKPSSASVTKNAATGLWSLDIVMDNADELHLNGTASCSTCCTKGSPLDMQVSGQWVTVATSDLKVIGNSLTVVGSGLAPTSVRGMFGGYPQCAFYNAQTLPSPTFILDIPTYYIN